MTGLLEARAEHRADLALRAEETDLHRSARDRADARDRGAELRLARPDPGGRERLGREELRRRFRDLVGLHGLDPPEDLLDGDDLGVRDERLPEARHAVGRALEREQHPPFEVLLRALELAWPEVPRRDVLELGRGDREALGEVVLAGADVDPDLAGLGVLRAVAVDAVGHPALLADLLEEPGGSRAAEDRVEKRDGVATLVVTGDTRPGEDDVVLLGLPAQEAVARPRPVAHERPPDARVAVRARAPGGVELDEPVVLDVARGREHDVRADVRPAVVRAQRPRRDRGDHLRAADHRPPQRVTTEDRLGREIVHEVLRVVVDHGDLLEDDLALAVDVLERGREDHVGHRVECALEVVVRHARVDDGRLA